jgi:hypothetical protein
MLGIVSRSAVTADDRKPEAPSPPRRPLLAALGLAAVLLGYGVLKLYGFGPSLSDENIYYYMARATAERGLLPYRDYFFAHPPMHVVPLIIVARLFPNSYTALQAMPAIAGAVAAVFIFLLAYRTWGALAATFAAALFLFNFQVLSDTTRDTGMEIAVALIAVALYFALTGRELWGGIMFGLAGLTGVYALAGAAAVAAAVALGGWRRLRPFVIGLVATWIGGNLVAFATGGMAYWRDVYLFALRIPGGRLGLPFRETVMMVIAHNYTVVWAAVLGVGLWAWEAISRWREGQRHALSRPRRRESTRQEPTAERAPWWRALWDDPSHRVMAGATVYVIATFLFFVSRGNLAQYYFMLPFPGLALLGGRGAAQSLTILWGALAPRFARKAVGAPTFHMAPVAVACLLAAGVGVRYWLGATSTVRSNLDDPPKTHVWSDAPLIGPVNDIVRALFWRDTTEPGRIYSAVQEYLWRRSFHFDTGRQIAEYVRRNTGPEDTIFGDMLLAPLVALLADRRIAGDVADTNEARFDSGMYTVEQCWRDIESGPAVYIILPQLVSLGDMPAFRERLARDYWIEREFEDPVYGKIALLRRRTTPSAPRPDR